MPTQRQRRQQWRGERSTVEKGAVAATADVGKPEKRTARLMPSEMGAGWATSRMLAHRQQQRSLANGLKPPLLLRLRQSVGSSPRLWVFYPQFEGGLQGLAGGPRPFHWLRTTLMLLLMLMPTLPLLMLMLLLLLRMLLPTLLPLLLLPLLMLLPPEPTLLSKLAPTCVAAARLTVSVLCRGWAPQRERPAARRELLLLAGQAADGRAQQPRNGG